MDYKLNSVRELLHDSEFLSLDIPQKKRILNEYLKVGLEKNDLIILLLEQISIPAQINPTRVGMSRINMSRINTSQNTPSRFTRYQHGSHSANNNNTLFGYDILSNLNSYYDQMLIVYILGAGPVGLLTAIKLIDIYGDKVGIILFEKREVYTRERVLFVNKHAIHDLLPKQLLTKSKMAEYGCSLPALPANDLATCAPSENLEGITRLAISTRVLEDDLKSLLDSDEYRDQVKFIYAKSGGSQQDTDKEYIEKVNELFPPHVFIGADGGNLSPTLYGNTERVPSAGNDCLDEHDNKISCPLPIWTYGLVVQFIPEEADTNFKTNTFPKRQNRYRVFRQQFKKYPKFNNKVDKTNNTPTIEPLSYYIAVQLNEAEREHIITELGGQESVRTYTLGDPSSKGKYLDRLIYDAGHIYNFALRPGRIMNGVSLFKLDVIKMDSENYSRVIEVRNKRYGSRYVWFPVIGDSVLSVNFFSGTGVNAGFAMIDILLQSLGQLLPVAKLADLFAGEEQEKIKEAGFTPGGFMNLSPYIQKEILGPSGHLKLPVKKEELNETLDPSQLLVFKDSTKLEVLVESYRTGIDLDLNTASFDTEGQPGMDRLLTANAIFSRLEYNDMITHCNGDPKDFNRLKQLDKANGIEMEVIDLDYLDGVGSKSSEYNVNNKLYNKADDRFCLVSYGAWGPQGN